jgi:hypothetical protein
MGAARRGLRQEVSVRLRQPAIALLAALALVLTLAASSATAAGAGVFHLTLTGDQEATPTCAPPTVCGDPDAIGHAVVVVIPQTDKVCFVAQWSDVDGTVVAAHLHAAPAGVPGPVVVPLFTGPLEGTDMAHDCVSANGLADAIIANPAGYYMNIHSTPDFGPGAIRDQLG